MHEKFVERAKLAINAGGVDALTVNFFRERVDRFDRPFTRWNMRFTFACPCGETRTETLILPDLWKSKFTRLEQAFTETIREHLRSEGLLPS